MNPDRYVFIIRIWHESDPGNPQLRGSIQLVSSTEKMYFSSLEQVPELLRALGEFESKEEAEGNEE